MRSLREFARVFPWWPWATGSVAGFVTALAVVETFNLGVGAAAVAGMLGVGAGGHLGIYLGADLHRR